MNTVPSIDRLVDLVEPLIDAIAARTAERIAGATTPDDAWYDQNTSPLSRRAYLSAARRGAFPARKLGRRVLARQADVAAYIESLPTHARAVTGRGANNPDAENRALLEVAGIRLRRRP